MAGKGHKPPGKPADGGPVLLSGGNPQIAKGYGQEPVDAYIAAMPGWKSAVGRWIDDLVSREVPDVSKAVKWNSPFYGKADGTYFLSMHVFARYVKLTFLNGAHLDPPPPKPSKHPDVRYLDIHEDDPREEAQLVHWIRQASRLPGEKL